MDITKAQFADFNNTSGKTTYSYAQLLAQLQNDLVEGGFPERARFHSEIDITALTSQQRTVPWDDIQIDTNEFFDPANDDRMTFKTAGVYLIGFQGQWNNSDAGGNFRITQIQGSGFGLDGGTFCRDVDVREIGTFPLGNLVLEATTMVPVSADTFIELRITQDSGVSIDWQTQGEHAPILWAQRVG